MENLSKLILDFGRNQVQGEKTHEEINTTINKKVYEILGFEDGTKFKDEVALAKALRGKESLVYAILEDIISEGSFKNVYEIPFFERFVEMRNLSEGDDVVFYAEGLNELVVSRYAGNGAKLNKQRIDNGAQFTVDMDTYGIAIIESLKRILLGRADWATLGNKLDEAVEKFIAQKSYIAFQATIEQLPSAVNFVGSFDLAGIIKTIETVQARSGVKPILTGTKSALSKLHGIEWNKMSDKMKNDRNELGYIPTFEGYDCLVIDQQLVAGSTTDFLFKDEVYIIATTEKPIKMVLREGLIGNGDEKTHANQSISMEYEFSLGISCLTTPAGLGRIKITA